jgi:ferritin-like metal-binding protein YciE
MKLESIQDVYADHLAELRSAETQLVEALSEMAEAASDKKLTQAFTNHREQTERHLERLEEIIGTSPTDVPDDACEAMLGLVREVRAIIEAEGPGDVKDVALIAAAQRIEHYEIAVYGTARALAEQLDLRAARDLLSETLDEESQSDELLTKLATGGLIVSGINERAHVAD